MTHGNITSAPADTGGNVVKLRSRKAKSLTPSETEALDRFYARRLEAALIQWPEIPPPQDWDRQTDEELADIDFEGIPEFRGDGYGSGSPEFRRALESYFHVINAVARHALAILGLSRTELVQAAAALNDSSPNGADAIARLLHDGCGYALRLMQCIRAAEVRHIVAITLHETEQEEKNKKEAALTLQAEAVQS
jgi:hypothetical protein